MEVKRTLPLAPEQKNIKGIWRNPETGNTYYFTDSIEENDFFTVKFRQANTETILFFKYRIFTANEKSYLEIDEGTYEIEITTSPKPVLKMVTGDGKNIIQLKKM